MVLLNGLSGYPTSTAQVQNIINELNARGSNCFRMSFNPSWSSGPHPFRGDLIEYFLANCNHYLIVDRNHLYPYGTTTRWSEIAEDLLFVAQNYDSHQNRMLLEIVNECTNSDLPARCQVVVDGLRGNGYRFPLVVNKWEHSWSSMASIQDTLNELYHGYHYYFTRGAWTSAESQMQQAINLGLKVVNTEVGANYNEYSSFIQSEVTRLNNFLAWCTERGIGNTVWMNENLNNMPTYKNMGLVIPPADGAAPPPPPPPPTDLTNYGDIDSFQLHGGMQHLAQYFERLVIQTSAGPKSAIAVTGSGLTGWGENRPEVNGQAFPLPPGKWLHCDCMVTSAPSSIGAGVIIGGDAYGTDDQGVDGRILEFHPRNPADGVFDTPHTGTAIYQPYGTTARIILDLLIPTKTFTLNDAGNPITAKQINSAIPWIGATWTLGEKNKVWFWDSHIYVTDAKFLDTAPPLPPLEEIPNLVVEKIGEYALHGHIFDIMRETNTGMPTLYYGKSSDPVWTGIKWLTQAEVNIEIFNVWNDALTPPPPPPSQPCAIASATQGTFFAGALPTLRLFRDRSLPKKVTQDYYYVSRYIAPFIDRLRRKPIK